MSESDLKDWNETFDHFDRDRSGTLDYPELKSCLRSVGTARDSCRPPVWHTPTIRVGAPPWATRSSLSDGRDRRAAHTGRAAGPPPGMDLPVVADGVREPEFDAIIAFCDPQNQGYVTRHSFIAFMTQRNSEKAQSASDILNAFALIAEDKPYVTEAQLQCVPRAHSARATSLRGFAFLISAGSQSPRDVSRVRLQG